MKLHQLFEIKAEEVQLHHEYHDTLNPAIWKEKKLKKEVVEKLTEIASVFKNSLKIKELKVKDIVLVGSSVNYNWTKFSDLDLHLIVDVKEVEKQHGDLMDEFFLSKKKIFNEDHDITIYGITVELYTQDSKEKNISGGAYSIKNNKWIKEPNYDPPSIDDIAVKRKTASIMNEIDSLSCHDTKRAKKLKDKIKNLRKSGLEKCGEYSIENLAFKTLRNNGYLEKLDKCYRESIDKSLSLK